MDIQLANPRGFCAGVDRAITIVERALEMFSPPVYVRHEVVHAIQHCVNAARGTSTDTAVIDDPDQLLVWAREHLTRREIQWIQDTYPRDQWMTEIEAFAGARAYTSSELEEMFLEICTLQG